MAEMRGYKVRAITKVAFSQDILVVSFVDTHGRDFNRPCICERFKELATNLGPAQLQNTLNESTITVLFSHGVIRTINLEIPSRSSTAETQVIQGTSTETDPLKPDDLSGPSEENSKESESRSTSQRLAPLSMTPEERRQRAILDEWRRQIKASQMMFCPSCEADVSVRRTKRGQFRRQFYCNRCNKLLETVDDAD